MRRFALISASGVVSIILCVGCLFLVFPSSALAAETQTFCISGASTGVGWSSTLQAGANVEILAINPLPVGANATQIAKEWARRINGQIVASQYQAGPVCTQSDGSACFSITGPNGFTLSVATGGPDCVVTNNPSGCTFNPTVIEALVPVSCAIAEVPTLQPVSLWILGLAILATALFRLHRR